MATMTIPTEVQRGIARIRTLDKKERALQRQADDILSTSPVGQAPPVYHRTLDKAIAITKEKAKVWNKIRNYAIPGTGQTLWQAAIVNRLPTVNYGDEKHLDFYADDIDKLLQTRTIAKPEPKVEAKPGMIVGEQSGSLGIPQKVHTQKSTGKAVTASMDAFSKLQMARTEASPKDVLGTLSHEDASELIAGLNLRTDELDRRIYEGKATIDSIKESLDPRIAKLTELIPTTKEGRGEITHITKGKYKKIWGKEPPASIVSQGKVRWEYALDTIAQELHLEGKAQTEGKAPDEYLKGLIEDAKDTKELIRATQAEIHSDESTLKALDKLKDTIKARTTKTTTGPLLKKLAKAPRVKATAKPKPATRAKVMLAGVAQALIEKTQAKRSPRAIIIDNSILANRVLPLSKVEIWAKAPNRYDIRHVDTPGSGQVTSRTGFTDRGKTRLSRSHHRGWRKAKLA